MTHSPALQASSLAFQPLLTQSDCSRIGQILLLTSQPSIYTHHTHTHSLTHTILSHTTHITHTHTHNSQSLGESSSSLIRISALPAFLSGLTSNLSPPSLYLPSELDQKCSYHPCPRSLEMLFPLPKMPLTAQPNLTATLHHLTDFFKSQVRHGFLCSEIPGPQIRADSP